MMSLTACWSLSTRFELTHHGLSGAYCCFILKLLGLDEGYEDLRGEDIHLAASTSSQILKTVVLEVPCRGP